MAKYLTIDIGNSLVKMMAWVDGRPLGRALHGRFTPADIEHLCAEANGVFDCAAVCAVAPDTLGIVDAARRLSRKVIEVDSDTPLPFSLDAYTTRATLGADRIAALAGARSLFPQGDLLVVDCGTAVTYDRLRSDNVFAGGNIAPGIGMRLRALHAFTARLPEVTSDPPTALWGHSTTQAMLAGAYYGVAAEIEFYRSQCPHGTRVVITGGRASDVDSLLHFSAHIDPDLVLRGLKHIIEYNEDK